MKISPFFIVFYVLISFIVSAQKMVKVQDSNNNTLGYYRIREDGNVAWLYNSNEERINTVKYENGILRIYDENEEVERIKIGEKSKWLSLPLAFSTSLNNGFIISQETPNSYYNSGYTATTVYGNSGSPSYRPIQIIQNTYYQSGRTHSTVYGNNNNTGFTPGDVKFQSTLEIPKLDLSYLEKLNNQYVDYLEQDSKNLWTLIENLDLRRAMVLTIQDEKLRKAELDKIQREGELLLKRNELKMEQTKRLLNR